MLSLLALPLHRPFQIKCLIVCVTVAVLSAMAAPLGAQDGNVQSLEKRVEALEAQNAELQALVQRLLAERPGAEDPSLEAMVENAPNAFVPKTEKLTISGEIRVRPEYNNNFDYDDGHDNDNAVYLDSNDFVGMRSRLSFDFNAHENLRAFLQIQDSRLWGEEASTATDDQNLDFHQAYFDLRNLAEWAPTVRVGRHVLSYGDQRLIGGFEWNNIARAFDGVRAWWERERWSMDLFATNVAEPDDLDFGDGGDADDDTLFSGVYGTYRLINEDKRKLSADAYALNLRNGNGATLGEDDLNGDGISDRTGDLDFVTLGMRWTAKLYDFDFGVEAAWQTGTRGHDDVNAWAWHARAGYTCTDWAWQPRIGAEYNFASGDADPADGDHETFANLFPTNHLHYGYMDQISWQNMRNARFSLSAKPFKKTTVAFDYHMFWLDEEEDAYYTVAGAARPAGASFNGGRAALQPGTYLTTTRDDHIGNEIDVTVKYTWADSIRLAGGYSHFFAGDFLDDTGFPDPDTGLNAKADDADWAYFELTVSF